MTSPPRPDQATRQGIPLPPAGLTIAQAIQQGLLTNADMVALGLMKDLTGQTMLTSGVPPGVPLIKSVQQINANLAGSPYTMFTFTGAGRVWGVSLNYELVAQAAYAGGLSSGYARVETGSGTTLEIIGLSINAAGQIPVLNAGKALNGLPIANTDTIILDINNAVGITNAFQRASAVVLYSIP